MNKFIPILIVSVLFSSCWPTGTSHPNKIDTIPEALFRIKAPNGKWSGPILDTALSQIVSRYVFTDTVNNKGGHWVSDTTNYGRIIDDTARDGAKKPVFDSLHHPVWHYVFYAIPKGCLQKVTIAIK